MEKKEMKNKTTDNFNKQLEYNSMKTYLHRLRNNDAIFNEVRYVTGFPELDMALSGGFVAGLHCIGAISSIGKTTFVLQMGDNMARNGVPVIIFSLEMRPEQLVAKNVSRNMYLVALEHLDKYYRNHYAKGYAELMSEKCRKSFTDDEQILYAKSLEWAEKPLADIQIVSEKEDGRPFDIDEIVNYINSYIFVTKKKPVVIIDYLQFIRPGKTMNGGTDKQIMDYIISMLVSTAKMQRIPIIAISSLNRGGYDSPLTMASFKESGFIEYSCETLLGLQLKGVGEKDFNINVAKAKNPREVELVLLKGRGIEVGTVIDYLFYGKHNFFEELGRVKQEKENIESKTERKRVR